jgi:NAD(P)-dependent dehydrogenase (short-subunit alcohol dehydrogenase family)
MRRTAVNTGACSGIGPALARRSDIEHTLIGGADVAAELDA